MTTANYQETKSFVYSKKLYTGLTWEKARKVSLVGAKAITGAQRKELYKEYKEDEALDEQRLKVNVCINTKTNLAIK
jgi:hypothetical protein